MANTDLITLQNEYEDVLKKIRANQVKVVLTTSILSAAESSKEETSSVEINTIKEERNRFLLAGSTLTKQAFVLKQMIYVLQLAQMEQAGNHAHGLQ